MNFIRWKICLIAAMSFILIPICDSGGVVVKADDLPSGLLAYWLPGEKADILPDLSGNGHDGVFSGEEQKPVIIESDLFGKALHFTHIGNRGGPSVRLSDEIWPPSPALTIAAWIRLDPEGRRSDNYIVCSGAENLFMVWLGCLRFEYQTEERELQRFIVSRDDFEITPNNWHFVAVTHDNTKVKMYIDGRCLLSEDAVGYPRKIRRLTMGNFSTSLTSVTFQGAMGPVLMFDRALEENEILGMMASFLK